MKALPLFLALSLAANAAMAVAWFLGKERIPGTPRSASTPPASVVKSDQAVEGPRFQWETLQKRTPGEIAAELAQAGISEEDAKVISNFDPGTPDTPLHDDLREDYQLATKLRREFGDLPIETLQRILRLRREYENLQVEVFQGSGPTRTEQDRAKIRDMEKAFNAELAKLLTPWEYEQYEFRSSDTAYYLRGQLWAFRPTEEEYKAIFRLHHAMDEAHPRNYSTDRAANEATDKARKADYDQLKPQIEALLGPARYEDYLEAHERGTDKLNRLVGRLELPLAVAGKVNAVRDDLTQQAALIRSDVQLAPADREARLATLGREAETKITALLGTDGFDSYEAMKGNWIRTLNSK